MDLLQEVEPFTRFTEYWEITRLIKQWLLWGLNGNIGAEHIVVLATAIGLPTHVIWKVVRRSCHGDKEFAYDGDTRTVSLRGYDSGAADD